MTTLLPLNFASTNNSVLKIADLIVAKTKLLTPDKLIIAVGGDITNKANPNKYQDAKAFLKHIQEAFPAIPVNYLICPGNHDIQRDATSKLNDFNLFATDLTEGTDFIYSSRNTSILQNLHGWSFVISNSVYQENIHSALIDIDQLEAKFSLAKRPIAWLTHHHLIPISPQDTSTIRNAYNVFKLCFKYHVKLVLHGHVHSSFRLDIINASDVRVPIIGCGAVLPNIGHNYNNQFNLYTLQDSGSFDIYPYRIINDAVGIVGPSAIDNSLSF
jgi:3',5'-cyclic AMP phosphodiesterase CpdA